MFLVNGLNTIFTVYKINSVSEFTWCLKLPDLTSINSTFWLELSLAKI